MGQIKAIITDFDGTLVFTKEANTKAYQEACKLCGHEFDADKYKNEAFGLRFNEMCDYVGIPQEIREKVKELKKKVYPKYFNYLELNLPLFLTLIRLHNEGVKTCIASTASKENLNNVLKYLDIEDIFDYVITGEDVKHGKPDPEVYLKALEKCECNPEDAVIYEDSEVGFKAAEAANVKYISVNQNYE